MTNGVICDLHIGEDANDYYDILGQKDSGHSRSLLLHVVFSEMGVAYDGVKPGSKQSVV